jgi:hypothetical protein
MGSRAFIRTLLGAFVVLTLGTYLLILLVDPYCNVPFSLPLDRAPISTNQRFAYPTLARDRAFDSVIIGSSTLRLLNPDNLNTALAASFANLAMNSATAYEQMRLYDLFMRHHQETKFTVIGIDDSWCKRESVIEKYTFRQFPEWMYDDNRWNDLFYLFNDKALENTVRLLEYIGGARRAKYEKNGYRDFTVYFGGYDRDVVAKRLYPKGRPSGTEVPVIRPRSDHPEWEFAAHALLEKSLREHNGKSAQTVLVFTPMHGAYLVKSSKTYTECKARILHIASTSGVRVLDFMVDSTITANDDNYWDPLHFTSDTARVIEGDIARELLSPGSTSERYLAY